jgi:hypothetical protein
MYPETKIPELMKMKFVQIFPAVCALLWFLSCKEPFEPQFPFEETNFLVVEGYINVGEGVTTIHLMRSTPLDSHNGVIPEKEAIVVIEDNADNEFVLTHAGDGVYKSDHLILPADRQYRIRIVTSNDRVYRSAFTDPIHTPEIDSVYWEWSPTQLEMFVTTHDGPDRTVYYQWDFEEIWEIQSVYRTLYSYEGGGRFAPRPNNEIDSMYRCWKYSYPKRLLMASTAPLMPDAPLHYTLATVPYGDDRMSYKYFIKVRQHALSRQHYEYLELMDKNTSQVGSFFDPQPSELNGNITCESSPDEPVVGFIGSYETTEKERFIYPHELPAWDQDLSCFEVEVADHPDSLYLYFVSLGWNPTRGASSQIPNPMPITYFGSPPFCVDCSSRGGSSGKPTFWEN